MHPSPYGTSSQATRPDLFRDDTGNLATFALPLLLGSMGMTLLAVGAIMGLVPLVLAGAGLTVVGFAAYLIGEGVRQSELRAAKRHKKTERPRPEVRRRPGRPVAERSPLADAAVAALSGETKSGGIWPPLPSTTGAKPQGAPVSYWEPGTKVATDAFDDGDEAFVDLELVETAPAARAPVTHTHSGPSVLVAEADDDGPGRDYRIWPGAKDVGRWSHFTGESSRSERYTREDLSERMKERRARITKDLPTVGAILAAPGAEERDARKGMSRGKCSRCEAALWAPDKRPITLKCPGCGHKARLY